MYLPRAGGFCAAAVLLTVILLGGGQARAQNALCPSSFANQAGITFQGSSCTNGNIGAYSNAALISQSLGELASSSTEDATKAAMASISGRRAVEQQRCPEGFEFVAGSCIPMRMVSPFSAEPDATAAPMPYSLLALAPRLKAPRLKQPVAEPPHWAAWAQAYGDYYRQSGQAPGLGEFSDLALNVTSKTWTGGVLAGVDYTLHNVATAGDGLIVGMLAGYEASNTLLNASSISSDPATPNGFSTMTAHLSGPATGIYGSYFTGNFSTDLAFKAEFYELNLAFTDLLGFTPPPTTVAFSNTGATQLNNYTASGNVNYRLRTGATTWVEPTAGFQYTASSYASNAEQFGLADGSLLRLQGGAHFGFESAWNGVRLTTVVTGLLYDDVLVNGGVLANAPNPLLLSDEGKLRGEGIFTLTFFGRNGLNSFIQADLHGGEGLFSVGGKVGVRITR